MHLVRLIIEGLKGAGVEHTHQIVERAVIIRDDGEHGLLALAHQAQFHIVPAGDVHDLGQDEGRQPDGGGNQD